MVCNVEYGSMERTPYGVDKMNARFHFPRLSLSISSTLDCTYGRTGYIP